MPLTAIIIHVTQPGARADALIATATDHLDRATPAADERGHVRILLNKTQGAAWDHIHDALDAAGDDWREHLHMNARPE